MSKYLFLHFLSLLLLISSCSIFSDETNNYKLEKIESVPEEIASYRDRLNSLTDDQRKISRKTISVKLPDDSEIEFIWIPATTSREWKKISGGRDYYIYGDDKETYSPYRFVRLTYGYFISKTEITQSQWKLLMEHNPSENRQTKANNFDNHPKNSVSWDDSKLFIDRFKEDTYLSLFDRIKKYISYNDYIFRLPTEVEWEYAARAAMHNPSEGYIDKTSWSNSLGTTAVASKSPNPWGVYDILGNVFEYTQDCWPTSDDIKHGDQSKITTNPLGFTDRINSRGGAYHSRNYHVKSFGWRNHCRHKEFKEHSNGLRLVFAPAISKLNKVPPKKHNPRSILNNEEKQPLKMISKPDCDNNLKINNAYIFNETDRLILFDVCYEYNGKPPLSIAAITYKDGNNTGKWKYWPGIIKPGKGCTSIRLGKSSLYAYSSDAILIKTNDFKCEAMFEYKKFWTNGADVIKGKKTEHRHADKYTINFPKLVDKNTSTILPSEQILTFSNNEDYNKNGISGLKDNIFELSISDNTKIEFVWIPPTTSTQWKDLSGGLDYYVYGDNLKKKSPYRLVKLTYGFFISKTEITQNQWEHIMFRNPSMNKGVKSYVLKRFPVNNISQNNALDFARKLYEFNSSGNKSNFIQNSNYIFRLPTEGEWEYAARAGMNKPRKEYLDETAWYNGSHDSIQNVASKKLNPWGIFDMLGNVNEITQDCWPTSEDIKYSDPTKIRINPVGSLTQVNFRGGNYYSNKQVESFGWRSGCQHPTHKTYFLGARIVLAPALSSLNIEPEPQPISQSILISTEQRNLKKHILQRSNCDNDLEIKSAYIKKEYNNHIILDVCYDTENNVGKWLSAKTFMKGKNTDKSGYLPGQVTAENKCAEISLFKNSTLPYYSDSILINSYDDSCQTTFEYDKYWTNDTDIYRSLSKH